MVITLHTSLCLCLCLYLLISPACCQQVHVSGHTRVITDTGHGFHDDTGPPSMPGASGNGFGNDFYPGPIHSQGHGDGNRLPHLGRGGHDVSAIFNLTEAVAKGRLFQTEVCLGECHRGVTGLPSADARNKGRLPRCPNKCHCDDKCDYYNDCCPDPVVDYRFDPSPTPKTLTTHCFQYTGSRGVTVIASCPENYVKGENSFRGVDVPNEARLRVHVRECNACSLRDNGMTLVTSETTHVTYCNAHCLACHEPRTETPKALDWSPEERCRVGNQPKVRTPTGSEGDATHGDTSPGDVTHRSPSDVTQRSPGDVIERSPAAAMPRVCWTTWRPPVADLSLLRECVPEAVLRRLEKINDCVRDPEVAVDRVTLGEMKSLCHSYDWPVYTSTAVFRNIFCFLCNDPSTGSEPDSSAGINSVMGPNLVGDPSLAMLTDLTGRYAHVDGDLELQAHDALDEDDGHGDGHTSGPGGGGDVTECAHGLVFNALTGNCSVVRCPKGLNLTMSPDPGTPTSEPQPSCLAPNNGRDNTLYILKMQWYPIQADGQNDDVISGLDALHDTTKDSQWPPRNASFSCEGEGQGQTDRPVDHWTHGYLDTVPTVSMATQWPFYSVEPNLNVPCPSTRDGGMSNECREAKLNSHVLNQTNDRLQRLNVSSFLLKFHSGNKTDQKEPVRTNTHDTREMVVYFHESESKFQNNFQDQVLQVFSERADISSNETTLEFRSVLVKRLHSATQGRDSFLYFSTMEREREDKSCCQEINFHTFSTTLANMTCSHGNANPTNIHLVSTCPHVTFDSSDFNATAGQTLIHKESGLRLQRHQYLYAKSKVFVCFSTLESLRRRTPRNASQDALVWWESFLTLLLLPVSMLGLLTTFVVYCVFPILRSLPGKNNMFLVFWLFWAQGLLLLSGLPTRHSPACVAMGMLLHFAWLTTFAWTCVCSFHMFNVFVIHKGTSSESRSHTWFLAGYCAASHALPLLVIVLVSAIWSSLSRDHSPGYGGGVCYLNSPMLVGLAFMLPLGVILLANIVFFCHTIAAIARIEKVKRQMGISEKRNTHVYLRLSSLTSVTWILALLAEVPGCQFLRLLSVVVNASQGVFLFVSYVVNSRVKRLWASMRKRDKNRKSSSLTNLNTTSGTSTKLMTLTASN